MFVFRSLALWLALAIYPLNTVSSSLSPIVIVDESGEKVITFQDYDETITLLDKSAADEDALRSFGISLAEKILQSGEQSKKLKLQPLRNYDSLKTQIVWQALVSEFQETAKSKNCQMAKQKGCAVYWQLYPVLLLELMIANSKQVYYNPSRDKKALAHQEAVNSFSQLRKIIEEESSVFSISEHLAAKTYLLAHELTNQPYYKFLFSYYSNRHLSNHFYGERQFNSANRNSLKSRKPEVIARAEEIQQLIGPDHSKKHSLSFFLDMALTEFFAEEHAYLIDDEKGRLLGDEWKLYNNSVPYFESGLIKAISLLDRGKTFESFSWTKLKLVDRSIKVQGYAAKKSIGIPWGEFRLDTERTYDDVSKLHSWSSLALYIAVHTNNVYRDRGFKLPMSVDGNKNSNMLDQISKYL